MSSVLSMTQFGEEIDASFSSSCLSCQQNLLSFPASAKSSHLFLWADREALPSSFRTIFCRYPPFYLFLWAVSEVLSVLVWALQRSRCISLRCFRCQLHGFWLFSTWDYRFRASFDVKPCKAFTLTSIFLVGYLPSLGLFLRIPFGCEPSTWISRHSWWQSSLWNHWARCWRARLGRLHFVWDSKVKSWKSSRICLSTYQALSFFLCRTPHWRSFVFR